MIMHERIATFEKHGPHPDYQIIDEQLRYLVVDKVGINDERLLRHAD